MHVSRDLGVGQAASHGAQDFLLTEAQRFERLGRSSRSGACERLEQPYGDARRDEGVAACCGVNGLDEQVSVGVLEQESSRPARRAACTYSSKSNV